MLGVTTKMTTFVLAKEFSPVVHSSNAFISIHIFYLLIKFS